ncbi:MAG TPA: M6 family metalloprotease domain-containing protein [Gemmatimonadales bacterium]|nr:M6 family metalloprotease domain-containing protein [Gemmatimonadales bacterium]
MTPSTGIAAFIAVGVVCLAPLSTPLAGQQRRVEQLYTADGLRLDFPPDGVWRFKARGVAEARAQALGQGRLEALNAPQAAVIGGVLKDTLFLPSFLVGFSNTDTTALPEPAAYDSIFYTSVPKAGRAYTLKTFYQEMSNGVFHVAGQTFDWVLGDSSNTYYLDPPDCSANPLDCPQGRQRLRELFVEALAQYDDSVDYGQFDNDGPDGVPNSGDDDGFVDLVQFVQPVRGAECSGPGYNAHHWSLAGLANNPSGRYTTGDAKSSGGFITVDSYQIVAGVGGTGCFSDTQIMAIGTSAHELGHGLNLPDLYDVSGATEGVGEWSLMGSGNFTSLNSPAHLDAWSMLRLGWVAARELGAAGTYDVGQVQTADTVFLIRPLGTNPNNEYFLLENKQARESDTYNMQTGGGAGPKLGGLLVWHIDSTKTDATDVSLNQVNAGSIHGVALVQADAQRHLDKQQGSGGNRGDAGDPYPGSTNNKKFSYGTNPKAVKNSDTTAFVGFEIDSVTMRLDSSMIFKLSFGGPTVVRATDLQAQVSVDGTRYSRFSQLLAPGSTHTIAIDSAQLTTDSLTQYVFQSWSDGGAISHDITGQLEGDSISATVSIRLRVRATASGSGTITPTPAGDVAKGIYVLKDSTLSLKATPGAGKIFVGWSGDTTSAADSIRLTVSKKYTVTASFGDQLAASAGMPPAPVMGKAYTHTLTATGGTGSYSWQVISGALPDGLSLSSAGAISGIPATTGSFSATARVTSGSQTAEVVVALTVTAPVLVAADVVSHVLGTRQALSADHLKYLDLLGNNSGGFDVGDFLAWVDATGAQAPEIAAALARLAPAAPTLEQGRRKP